MLKTGLLLLMTVGACSPQEDVTPTTGTTAQAVQQTLTRITVNGQFASALLVDSDTNGGVTASRDDVAGTTALDFSWASPDPSNANQVILVQGAGAIPNSAFTTGNGSAHLAVTTAFDVNRCVIDLSTGGATCSVQAPITFNLTWTRNGFGSTVEFTNRTEVLGPVTTKFHGQFTTQTANVSGTWDAHTASNLNGDISDSQSRSTIREISMM